VGKRAVLARRRSTKGPTVREERKESQSNGKSVGKIFVGPYFTFPRREGKTGAHLKKPKEASQGGGGKTAARRVPSKRIRHPRGQKQPTRTPPGWKDQYVVRGIFPGSLHQACKERRKGG